MAHCSINENTNDASFFKPDNTIYYDIVIDNKCKMQAVSILRYS